MVRQTINCDICAAEKQATSYWFVAYERDGEIRLRAWEPSKGLRKNMKHLCGQKCVQRLMSNFTEAVKAAGDRMEAGKELAPVVQEAAVRDLTAKEVQERQISAVAARIEMDPVQTAAVEAESWAGPVRLKETMWDTIHTSKLEPNRFAHAARQTPASARHMQKMA
jgi:hypothetical protein